MKRSMIRSVIQVFVVAGVVFIPSSLPSFDEYATPHTGDRDGGIPVRQDSDGDGVPDDSDNCPDTYNPDQLDLDGFEDRVISGETDAPASVFAADVDGDGDTDVLSASHLDDKVAWYENLDGAGNFGPQHVITTEAAFADFVSTADVDGDGDLDALAIYETAVAWYENQDGDGAFGPPRVIGTVVPFTRDSVYGADLDGDLDNDILLGGHWYENQDGDGQFGPAIDLASGVSSRYAVAVDVDRDSNVDVVGRGGGLWWYRNAGGASSFSPIAISTTAHVGPVVAVDLDGDEDADVLAVQEEFDGLNFLYWLVWYENTDGAGGFGPPNQLVALGINEVLPFYLSAADVDGDGDTDVLSGRPSSYLAWYENLDGAGDFGSAQTVTSNDYSRINSIFAADIEGDGDADVVLADYEEGEIAWFRNGDGVGAVCDNCPEILNDDQADADLDGVGDLCDNCPEVSNHDQLDADGDGVGDVCDNCPDDANSNQADPDLDGIGNVCDNCPGDANPDQSDPDGDGFGDACDNCPDDPNAAQRDADGDGAGNACDCDESNPHCTTDCTDADGDGHCLTHDCNDSDANCDGDCTDTDLDGFCPPYDCDDARPHLSDTDGDAVPDPCDNCPEVANRDQLDFDSFGPQRVITSDPGEPWSVFAADLDGDGDTDALAALWDANRIVWYENTDGAGTFGPRIQIGFAGSATTVFAADLDGDGDKDVLFGSAGGSPRIAWYENMDGAGNFGPERLIRDRVYGNPWSIVAADVDHDGDLDIVFARGAIYWYENTNGAGDFASRQRIINTHDVSSLFVTDVDGDGDNDILAANDDDDEIAWYENTDGAGTFALAQVVSTLANDAKSVFGADVDGDGDVDALSASRLDDKIAWYENTDGLGSFGIQQVISTASGWPRVVSAADVDGDGDVDVLSASEEDPVHTIAWYENTDGLGGFGPLQVITTEVDSPRSLFMADVDGDGDVDALSASADDDKIAWYETIGDGAGDVCDCAPSDPLILKPPDVAGLGVRHIRELQWGWVRLTWSTAPGADTYSVTRGAVAGLAPGQFGTCLQQGITVNGYADPAVPDAGTGYAYLVQGVSNQCGPGPLGYDAGGVERINQDPGACP